MNVLESIMHYRWNAFAWDESRPTITAKSNNARIEPSNDFTEVYIFICAQSEFTIS